MNPELLSSLLLIAGVTFNVAGNDANKDDRFYLALLFWFLSAVFLIEFVQSIPNLIEIQGEVTTLYTP